MTLALVAVAATSAFAQISVGAGYLANTQKSSYTSGSTTTTTPTALKGAYLNADYTFDLGQGLGLVAGLKGSFLTYTHTTTILGVSGTTNLKELYLGVPVLCNYSYVLSNDLKLFAYAGPTFNIGLSSKSKFTQTVTDDGVHHVHADACAEENIELAIIATVGIVVGDGHIVGNGLGELAL